MHNSHKSIKYLGMNLTKKMKDIYSEMDQIMIKEIIKDTINGEISFSQVRRISIIKMFISLRVIYRFNITPNKIPMKFFTKLEKQSQNSYGITKDPE